jgi:hypothetical protein
MKYVIQWRGLHLTASSILPGLQRHHDSSLSDKIPDVPNRNKRDDITHRGSFRSACGRLSENSSDKAPREPSPAAKFRGGNSAYIHHEFVRQQHHFQQIAITLISWFGNVFRRMKSKLH